jgi:hypothetical protein
VAARAVLTELPAVPMLTAMLRKSTAALLVLLILLPFTAPFSSFSFAAPATTPASADLAADTLNNRRDGAESVGSANVLGRQFHAMAAERAGSLSMTADARERALSRNPRSVRDGLYATTVLRI